MRTLKNRQQKPMIELSGAWQIHERKSVATKSKLRERSASDAERTIRWLRILFALLRQFRRMRKKTSLLAAGESRVISTQALIPTETEGMGASKRQQPGGLPSWEGEAAEDERRTRGATVSVVQ